MKKFLAIASVFILGSSTFASVEDDVLEVMEEIGKPSKLIKRLVKKDDFKNPDFKKNAELVIKQYAAMKDIKHEEKMFNDFNAKMITELDAFAKVLKGDDFDAMKAGWTKVGAACKECHTEYK